MFEKQIYLERRKILVENFNSGLILFLGNNESPSNYLGNTYHFRQDSTFLYYIGLDLPDLAVVIDVDSNTSTLFGTDFSVDDIVWMGPQPKVAQLAELTGINQTEKFEKLHSYLTEVIKRGRKIHFLPQYRTEQFFLMGSLVGIKPARVNDHVSTLLIQRVVKQRSVKSQKEIDEIDKAVDIAYRMHTAAMRMIKPGMSERKIAGMIEGIAYSIGAGLAFRPIVSVNGQILHNHQHNNILENGSLLLNDSGAETVMHYASDITRTIPASGSFTGKQKEIYQIVLNSQMRAIEAVYPGVANRDLHLISAKTIVEGLSALGLMKGNADEAVQKGAHALFFPHGLGHMMGLDVHDMEGLGENFVGYDDKYSRSDQFGLAYLRLAKALTVGNVFTIEPGIYFIPELIDKWKSENKLPEFINYDRVEDYRNFGGIRIEDDILVTEKGYRVLGKAIPKTIEEVEELASK